MIERTPTSNEQERPEIDRPGPQGDGATLSAPVQAPEVVRTPEARCATDRYRVLIVDDERAVLDVVNEILMDQGYATVAVTSPTEALRKAKREKFDALILDVYMPEMSGMLFHAKLRVVDPELAERTVFMSGYVSQDELRQHLTSTPTFLEKPFKAQDLGERVGKVLPSKPRR